MLTTQAAWLLWLQAQMSSSALQVTLLLHYLSTVTLHVTLPLHAWTPEHLLG